MSVNFDEYINRIQNEKDIFAKATYVKFLTQDKGYSIKSLADALELSPSYICNLLRLLRLPELIRDGYYTQLVTPTHLYVISRLHSHEDMIQVYEQVLAQSISTSELEALVRKKLHGIATEGDHVDNETLQSLENALKSFDPDAHVKIVQTRIKGKIIFEKKGTLTDTSEFITNLTKKLSE